MDPAAHTADISTEPIYHGRYVTFNGVTLRRFAGGESDGAPAGVQPDVQPDAEDASGQGDAGQGGEGLGLYDLSDVPEELRPFVEEQAKKIEANVTRRFQEHAEERARWEPLASIEGLTDVPGEELAELVQFREIASDPEKFEEWWNNAGEALGLFADDEDGEGDDFGVEFEEGEGEESELVSELRAEIDELKEALGPIQESQATSEAQQRVESAKQVIRSDLDAIKAEHHADVSPEEWETIEGAVLKLAHAYSNDPDAIRKAHQDFLEIGGHAQSSLVESKLEQPRRSLNGGQPATEADKPGFGDPRLKEAARARVLAGG